MNGLAVAPATELGILHGTISNFTLLSGAALAIWGVKEQSVELGSPKILAIAGIIGGISAAISILGSAFRNNQAPFADFRQSLGESRDAHQNLRDELAQGERTTEATARALNALLGFIAAAATLCIAYILKNFSKTNIHTFGYYFIDEIDFVPPA